MDWIRFTKGFLLSFVFVFIFGYMICSVQYNLGGFIKSQNNAVFAGSIADSPGNIVAKPVVKNILQLLPAPEINAESSISVESNLSDADKVLFEKNIDTKLPIASLTKLMTAVIVLDNYNLLNNITIDQAADSQEAMKQDISFGSSIKIESLLDIMLIESSNKSAYALSEAMGEPAFVNLMNKKAEDIGLKNTFFADPTGLSDRNISTANDLSKLAEYILKNYPKIVEISGTRQLFVPGFGTIDNTDELLGEVPEAICSKTGFTPEAKGCLLLVLNNPKNNDYVINIILGADERFSEMKKLINWSNITCN